MSELPELKLAVSNGVKTLVFYSTKQSLTLSEYDEVIRRCKAYEGMVEHNKKLADVIQSLLHHVAGCWCATYGMEKGKCSRCQAEQALRGAEPEQAARKLATSGSEKDLKDYLKERQK